MIKKNLFGYNTKKVDELIKGYNYFIETQRKDIEYLKQDNERLKQSLFEISEELKNTTHIDKKDR